MSLIRTLTQLDQDLLLLDNIIARTAEAAHHYAVVSSACNVEFWAIPIERLLPLLNADVPRSLAILTGNTELNTQVNASLVAVGDARFTSRAPVTMGRSDISFNGTEFIQI